MDIFFQDVALGRACSIREEMVRRFGHALSVRLSRRLQEIQALDSIGDLQGFLGSRCREVSNGRDVELAVDVDATCYLLLRPLRQSDVTRVPTETVVVVGIIGRR